MNTEVEHLFKVNESDFSEPGYHFYEQARKSFGWETELDWNNIGNLPQDKADSAWQLASQSSYAEQLGMVIASRLLCNSEDFSVRLYLASAVQDEARHIEVFSRYALLMRGYVAPPVKQDIARINEQISVVESFIPQFLVHTVLESFAADSFLIFAKYYKGDLLGHLYHMVHKDETRHVAAGLAFLRTKARKSSINKKQIIDNIDVAYNIGNLGEDGYTGLAAMVDNDPTQLRDKLLKNFESRIKTIFE